MPDSAHAYCAVDIVALFRNGRTIADIEKAKRRKAAALRRAVKAARRAAQMGNVEREAHQARERALKTAVTACTTPGVLRGLGVKGEAAKQLHLWQRAGLTPQQACREMGEIESCTWDLVERKLLLRLRRGEIDDHAD